MATAQTIIDRALRLVGAIGSGESPTAQESADALVALNDMVESWSLEKLAIYVNIEKTFTFSPGNPIVTLGVSDPASNIDARPIRIEEIFVRDGDIDYPVEMIDLDRWAAIADKTNSTDIPQYAYLEATAPVATLTFWPIPNTPNELHVFMWQQLESFADLTTDVALPPGYSRAMAYNLAVELAPEYQLQIRPEVAQSAVEGYANVKRANNQTKLMIPDNFGIVGYHKVNIYAGE